jgi:ATP-dependent exoDNAse (exonuclease V) alpha subunit
MTINKAQGQTLERVGVYLPSPVFTHGQLYVALSRCGFRSAVKVLVNHGPLGPNGRVAAETPAARAVREERLKDVNVDDPQITANVVYTNVLAMVRDRHNRRG